MDGKHTWRCNVFVQRIWKSVKCEEVYLHAYGSLSNSRASIGQYLAFYNRRRTHQSLGRQRYRSPREFLADRSTAEDVPGL